MGTSNFQSGSRRDAGKIRSVVRAVGALVLGDLRVGAQQPGSVNPFVGAVGGDD